MAKDFLRAGAVGLCWGRLGAGKTSFGVKLALAGSRCVVSTAPLRADWPVVSTWDEVVAAEGALVLFDEAHLWFPGQAIAGRGARLDERAIEILTLARKRDQVLVLCAQHPMRLAAAVRQVLTHVWRCRLVYGSHHKAEWMDPDTNEVYWRSRFQPRKVPYDTLAIDVGPRDAAQPVVRPAAMVRQSVARESAAGTRWGQALGRPSHQA